jgi:hypothetical protein
VSVLSNDPMVDIADTVAYCFSQRGYAFIEDDEIDALAETLRAFLRTAGIAISNTEGTIHPVDDAAVAGEDA